MILGEPEEYIEISDEVGNRIKSIFGYGHAITSNICIETQEIVEVAGNSLQWTIVLTGQDISLTVNGWY